MSTEVIKELRQETGLSFGEIKKALDEADGDKDKALEILSAKAKVVADKKGDRSLGAGVIGVYVYTGSIIAAMVELRCETDFVAKNEEFIKLANDIAFQVVAMNPTSLDAEDETSLLQQNFIKDPSKTITQMIDEAVQKFGENIKLLNFIRYSI